MHSFPSNTRRIKRPIRSPIRRLGLLRHLPTPHTRMIALLQPQDLRIIIIDIIPARRRHTPAQPRRILHRPRRIHNLHKLLIGRQGHRPVLVPGLASNTLPGHGPVADELYRVAGTVGREHDRPRYGVGADGGAAGRAVEAAEAVVWACGALQDRLVPDGADGVGGGGEAGF